MKSVLLYGCETWLVTNEIQRKIQTFMNRCLRYILRIWWPNSISNKDLWKVKGQEDINLEIRKRKFSWIGHTLRKEDGEIPKAALLWNPQGNRKRGRPRNSWRRSVVKEAGRSWNELRFLSADRQKWKGLIRQPLFLEGTMDSIIIILLHCLFTVFRDPLSFSFVWLSDLYINMLVHVVFSFLWY